MKKVGIIAILAVIIVLVVGCFAIYSYYINQKKEENFRARVQDFKARKAYFEDFNERIENDDVRMDSDKAKVSVKIPRGWDAFEGSFSAISMKSKDFLPMDGDVRKAPIPSTGCWIDFNVQIDKVEDGYKNLIQLALDTPEYFLNNNKEQKVRIGELNGIKTVIFNNENNFDFAVFVEIPKGNITYKVDSYIFGTSKERCEKEFDDFLNSLVIK